MEISKMLKRLQAESAEKNEEIQRLQDMQHLHSMVEGSVKSGRKEMKCISAMCKVIFIVTQ